jgi:hypothetical protein
MHHVAQDRVQPACHEGPRRGDPGGRATRREFHRCRGSGTARQLKEITQARAGRLRCGLCAAHRRQPCAGEVRRRPWICAFQTHAQGQANWRGSGRLVASTTRRACALPGHRSAIVAHDGVGDVCLRLLATRRGVATTRSILAGLRMPPAGTDFSGPSAARRLAPVTALHCEDQVNHCPQRSVAFGKFHQSLQHHFRWRERRTTFHAARQVTC